MKGRLPKRVRANHNLFNLKLTNETDQQVVRLKRYNAAVMGIFCVVEFWGKVAKPPQNGAKQKMSN
jgi:hypothetical protein